MSAAAELKFSDPELTFLAIKLGNGFFPATPLPDLDADSWQAVERGLIARGIVRGHFRLTVDDDVADVLQTVIHADCSLWTQLRFAVGIGGSRGQVLWFKDGRMIRQATTDGTTSLAERDRSAVDEMLAELVDFPDAAASRDLPEVRLPMLDLHAAIDAAVADGVAAAAARHPDAAGYVCALAEGRSTTLVEYRSAGLEPDRCERLSFAESRVHGLWLAQDDPHRQGELDGVMTLVQQVTVATARDVATTFVHDRIP
jgi:hypothetical protein